MYIRLSTPVAKPQFSWLGQVRWLLHLQSCGVVVIYIKSLSPYITSKTCVLCVPSGNVKVASWLVTITVVVNATGPSQARSAAGADENVALTAWNETGHIGDSAWAVCGEEAVGVGPAVGGWSVGAETPTASNS